LARRAGKRALAYAEQTGDPKVLAFAKGHIGCGHYFAARLIEAERLLREALAVLDRRGDSWERMFFYHNLRHLYAIWGDKEEEMLSAQVEIQIGETVKDPEGECWGAFGMANALARAGRLEEAREYMERAKRIIAGKTNIIVVPTALQTEGFLLLQSGDYEGARRALEEARAIVEANFAFVDYSIRVYPLLVETLLGPDWDQYTGAVTPTAAREGWRLSRWALFWAKRFPNYLPHAWRARGRAAWCKGHPQKALSSFRRALSAAERIGARYDLARTYLDLGRISVDQRRHFTDKGNEILQELGCVEPKVKR
jgi:eukaryotic-like serine/threonine-protein kinase